MKTTILVVFRQWLLVETFSPGQIVADELVLSETRLAGGQKQNRTFQSSAVLLESHL